MTTIEHYRDVPGKPPQHIVFDLHRWEDNDILVCLFVGCCTDFSSSPPPPLSLVLIATSPAHSITFNVFLRTRHLFIVAGAAVTTAFTITSLGNIHLLALPLIATFFHPSWRISFLMAVWNVSIFLNIIISCTQNVTDSFLIQFITSRRVTTAASHWCYVLMDLQQHNRHVWLRLR